MGSEVGLCAGRNTYRIPGMKAKLDLSVFYWEVGMIKDVRYNVVSEVPTNRS